MLEKLIGNLDQKREYKQAMRRVKALPEDYRYVYEKIQHYMWMHAAGDGSDMVQLQYDLIEVFESGAAEDKNVLDITGEDVATFCDELLCSAKLYTDNYRTKLNRDINSKFGKKKD